MLKRNSYTWAGLSLLVSGVLIFLAANFILMVTWLTAFGVAMLILSLILLFLGQTIPKIPPEVSSLLLQTATDNIASIIEELGISSKGIYLPSSLTGGKPQVLLPLRSNQSLPPITRALPQRLIVRYGAGADDIGLLLSTAGTTAASLLESRPGPTSTELETALTYLFRGILDVADGIRIITRENHISAEIYNPRIENNTTRAHQFIGGPLASIVASVAAEAWDKPVIIEQEMEEKGKYSIELEVLE